MTNRVINDVRIIFRQLLPPLKNIKYKDLSEKKKKYLGGKCMLEVVVVVCTYLGSSMLATNKWVKSKMFQSFKTKCKCT